MWVRVRPPKITENTNLPTAYEFGKATNNTQIG